MEPRKDWCCDWQSGGYESEKKGWGAVTKPSKISKPPISPNLRDFFGKAPLFAVLAVLALMYGLHFLFTVAIPQWERNRQAEGAEKEKERRQREVRDKRLDKEEAEREQLDALLDRLLADTAQYRLWVLNCQRAGTKLYVVPKRNLRALIDRGWEHHTVTAQGFRKEADGSLSHVGAYSYLKPPS